MIANVHALAHAVLVTTQWTCRWDAYTSYISSQLPEVI